MILIDVNNFDNFISSEKKALVFFYRENGCSFCDQMKPIIDAYHNDDFAVGKYALGKPDAVTSKFQFKNIPAFFAFVDGKLVGQYEGVLTKEQLPLVFTPDQLPKKIAPTVETATLLQLMTDEANLIDQIAPLRLHLAKIQKEMAKRRKGAMGDLEPCCDGCATGGGCESGH
jgi:thioredoxin-like negative regulator of GroEL